MNVQSYFNNYIQPIFEDVKKLEQLDPTHLEKLNVDLEETIPKHLKELTWCVKVLDPEADHAVLKKAFIAINELSSVLNDVNKKLVGVSNEKVVSEELKALLQKDISLVRKLRDGPLSDAVVETLHKYLIGKEMIEDGVIEKESFNDVPTLENILSEEKKEPSQAYLMMNHLQEEKPKQTALNKLKETTLNAMNYLDASEYYIFSKGKYYNPIPKPVSAYILIKDVDTSDAKKDVMSLLRGEKLEKDHKQFFNDKGSIADKYGEYVQAPGDFAADLPRADKFTLNGTCLYERKPNDNPNEVSRALYRTFGKEGAERLMYLFNQGCMPHILSKFVLPLIDEKGEFGKRVPKDKTIFPSNASGFVFNADLDGKRGVATVSIKIKMKLHSMMEKDFTAFFIVKRVITIPFAELTGKKADEPFNEENPNPGLHVTDYISKLVLNNPGAALAR